VIFLGIDPGVNGALAFFDLSCGKLDVIDMPTDEIVQAKGKTKRVVSERGLANVVRPRLLSAPHLHSLTAYVEKVSAAPIQGRRQGTVSMFNFGQGFGVIKGVFAGLGIEPVYVPPQRWKAALGLLKTTKNASRDLAKKLFPAYAATFSRVKDDGRAEAALIAHYAAMESPI
jgi:crossover junction endodeoxyribonuclease RuvC